MPYAPGGATGVKKMVFMNNFYIALAIAISV
jgi:hypothetical protein